MLQQARSLLIEHTPPDRKWPELRVKRHRGGRVEVDLLKAQIVAGGGWYAHIASQFSNMLSLLDVDPNGDHNASDAAVVGRVFLANASRAVRGSPTGVGGPGIKPVPTPYDGWIQGTVAARAQTDAEVQGWIRRTDCIRNPSGC